MKPTSSKQKQLKKIKKSLEKSVNDSKLRKYLAEILYNSEEIYKHIER